jgi:ABC-2 type transport system permease protein
MKLWAALTKETLALTRDLHALAALFIMPVVFILIMSLALQDTLSAQSAHKFSYLVDDQDRGALARTLQERFAATSGFTRSTEALAPSAALREHRVNFVLVIEPRLERGLSERARKPLVRIVAEPALAASVLALAQTQTELILAQLAIERLGRGIGVNLAGATDRRVAVAYFESAGVSRPPTAVQQSVPAWLVFAMFFIVIPLSTIFIAERDHGTLRRLRSMGASPGVFFAGKIVPFFLMNQVQAVAMLSVGAYLVPLFGSEALALNGSPAALALVFAATSLAAIGYAILVAVSAGSVAQATIIGGVGNILFGAIGGVMAPKFLMPQSMQRLAEASPMGWALEGMLDVLLRGAGVGAVAGRAAALCAFAAVCLAIAVVVFRYKRI